MRMPVNTSMPHISRRTLLLAGVAAASAAAAQDNQGALTAGQVIERIKANIGIPWREQTVDKIIVGNPDTPIKGIATTMMATLEVIERAAAAGKNMVITHESTFYSHQDTIDQLKDDPTYQYKLDFCRKHDVVSFHFHDHWHGHRPDGIATGMARELGWEKDADPNNIRLFAFPSPTPLARLAKEIQTRLKIRTMRVVGDPRLPVRHALASWGYVSQFPGISLLARPDIDVFIAGETREWELVEYAQDAIRSGKRKGLIILGHVVSEQAGMKYCAEWLRAFIPEVPIEFIAAAEPFWSPDHPVE
jgi:putative NIF3 family GTP cyclohydrolase 1 type 2